MGSTEALRQKARFFPSPGALRRWFEAHHAQADELWIAYPKKGTGTRGISYEQAVEEALCFGWVDGQVRSLDERSYANRYTPRRPGSRWSRTNVQRVEELSREGRMHPAGLAAFSRRDPSTPAGYSFEERAGEFAPPLLRIFRADRDAWAFFHGQAPSYRWTATFWVMSARREETRHRRLQVVVESSRLHRRIELLSPGRPRAPS